MARKRKTGDESYNARRREYRAAQRYMKKALATSGATSEKNRALAYVHLQNAIATYDPTQSQKISAPIANIAAQFGITIPDIRQQYRETTEKQRKKAIAGSIESLAKISDETRREQEAKILMANPSISKRILGGLVDIWGDKVKSGVTAQENRKAIEKAVFSYFKSDSWADVLDAIEGNIGNLIYSAGTDQEIYDTVKLALQLAIAGKQIAA